MLVRVRRKVLGIADGAQLYQVRQARAPPSLEPSPYGARGSSKTLGHVNFVESVAGDRLVCIGGNQGDAVTRKVYSKSKALAFRWPA